MENSWEATTEICLSATCHIKWPDLLPFLTKNVHNHDDKCESNTFYLLLLNLHLILELLPNVYSLEIIQQTQFTALCLEGRYLARSLRRELRFPLVSPLVLPLIIFYPAGERNEQQVVPSLPLCFRTARESVDSLQTWRTSSPGEGWQEPVISIAKCTFCSYIYLLCVIASVVTSALPFCQGLP